VSSRKAIYSNPLLRRARRRPGRVR